MPFKHLLITLGKLLLCGLAFSVGIIVGGVLLVLGIPTRVAGIGLLKRKSWAGTLALIVGIFAFFNFPFRTLIAIYTFWVPTNTETIKTLGASA